MNLISIPDLFDLTKGNVPPDLIDVRTPAEFHTVHIAGARLVPLDRLDCAAVLAGRQGQSNSCLYLVCQSGARAKKAAEKFSESGFSNCVVVEGGTQAWIEAGHPVERGARSVLPLDRQLQIVVGSLVLAGVLLSQFVNPTWIWLSGFVGAGLTFAGFTGICLMRSLLARMPWNQAASALQRPSCPI